ncbi:cGMP-dependent protein kinase 1 isoform X4 [Strongylocentrotus purpuratus]|uniref:cGMP-dependent protein kinase n=1 Tax=Strongylocentrotus purpuratus TaxID=7668 RepID=A0A7M7SVT6_STRPU|nr:cGMP-dependent protein kinase 1 isoform X4 [Strongylocentrotus purpuratus]
MPFSLRLGKEGKSEQTAKQPSEGANDMGNGAGLHSKQARSDAGGGGRGGGGDAHGGGGNGAAPYNNNTGSSLNHKTSANTEEVTKLKLRLQEAQVQLKECHEELAIRNAMVEERDDELLRVREEVNKLRAVLSQTKPAVTDGGGDGGKKLAVLLENKRNKKQGVSGESGGMPTNVTVQDSELTRHPKDSTSKQVIRDAILLNDFTKNFDSSQTREIVECMFPIDYKKGQIVINEGDSGAHFYVGATGTLEVSQGDRVLATMGPGKVFGELAILYNCTRTATITAVTDAQVWAIDRKVFQLIMMKTGMQRHEEYFNFLKSVPLLKDLSSDNLFKLANSLEVDFFHEGEYIIVEGSRGDTFYIISKGEVRITQSVQGQREPQEVRSLQKGDFFGEKALLGEDVRTANVLASKGGCECLAVDRQSFNELIGNMQALQDKNYGDKERGATSWYNLTINTLQEDDNKFKKSSSSEMDNTEIARIKPIQDELAAIHLNDLDIIATLGVGGFGRVELVQLAGDKRTFALKCLKKHHIVETRQQEHIFSEKKIMMESSSPFIVKLFKTFRDQKYIYMLMEVCLGGELWTILRDKGHFDDRTARFSTACVVEAFHYLHSRGIVYRDLKPENLLLDNKGYVKLVDFGFAKKIGFGRKTWTFCGTPEYVAPEIILNKGHDLSCDYWSLGILIFELLTGNPPFTANDPMKTYNVILKGIDMVEFPRKIPRSAGNLIKRLCRDNPGERIGYQKNGISDIKKHKWFQGFDWEGLRKQEIAAPLPPKVKGSSDCSNFDSYPKDVDIPADETSGWDEHF